MVAAEGGGREIARFIAGARRRSVPERQGWKTCRRSDRAVVAAGKADAALGGVDSKDSLLGANQIQGWFWEAVLGVMDRLVAGDAAGERMAPLILGRRDQIASTGRDKRRMFVEGVLESFVRALPGVICLSIRGLEQRIPSLRFVEPRGFGGGSSRAIVQMIRTSNVSDRRLHHRPSPQHAAGAKGSGVRRSAVRAAAGYQIRRWSFEAWDIPCSSC